MITWLVAHWFEILVHLGLDITGGITLRCTMGLCKHKHHQIMAFMAFSIIISVATVALIG